MSKTATIFLIFFIVLLVWIYYNRESGHIIEMNRLQKELETKYENKIDSIREVYKPYVEQYGIEKLAKIRAEENAKAWERRYRNEKNSNRAFSNVSIDSLLAKVPSR